MKATSHLHNLIYPSRPAEDCTLSVLHKFIIHRIAGNFRGAKYSWFRGWRSDHKYFTHEWSDLAYLYLQCKQQPRKYIIHKLSQYCWTTNILFPENYPLYGSWHIQYPQYKLEAQETTRISHVIFTQRTNMHEVLYGYTKTDHKNTKKKILICTVTCTCSYRQIRMSLLASVIAPLAV